MAKYLILLSVIAVVWMFIVQLQITNNQLPNNFQISNHEIQNSPSPTVAMIKNFPFTVQAPLGEWGNPIFQDGCEESSALMIQCSVNRDQCLIENGYINKDWAREQIVKMSEWEKEKYGGSTDTSVADTADRLLNNYFGITNYEVKELKNEDDLKTGVWIVPMDGQKLGNPHYKAPGPERHMVVVIGYDEKTDELITNDGGTKFGKGYRYKLDKFWEAIRDYLTGEHQLITKIEKEGVLINPY